MNNEEWSFEDFFELAGQFVKNHEPAEPSRRSVEEDVLGHWVRSLMCRLWAAHQQGNREWEDELKVEITSKIDDLWEVRQKRKGRQK